MSDIQYYISQVKLRLPRHHVASSLNDPMIATFINDGRRMVQRYTIDLQPEHYGLRQTVSVDSGDLETYYDVGTNFGGQPSNIYSYGINVDGFIDMYAVIFKFVKDGVTYPVNARRSRMQELYTIQMHAYNQPLMFSPVYTVEKDVNSTNYILYIGGMDIDDTTTVFDEYDSVAIELWYTTALSSLELRNSGTGALDSDLIIPIQYYELVVQYAVFKCLQYIYHDRKVNANEKELQSLTALVQQNYELFKIQQTQLLPSKEGGS